MAECAPSDQESEPRTSQNRLKYDRSFLLKLQWCAAARIKPSCLPNYPEVILDKQKAADRFADVKQRDRSTSPMKTTTRGKTDDELDSCNLPASKPTEVSTRGVEIFKVLEDLRKNLNFNGDRKESQRKKIPQITIQDDSDCTEPLVETVYDRNITEVKSIKDKYSQKLPFEAERTVNFDEKNGPKEIHFLDPYFESSMTKKYVDKVKEAENLHEPNSPEHTISNMTKTMTHEQSPELRQNANKNTNINQAKTKQDGNYLFNVTELKDIDNITVLGQDQVNLFSDSKKHKPVDMLVNLPNLCKSEQTQSKEKDKLEENCSFQEDRREVFENETLDFESVESTGELINETEIFCEPCEESNENERAVQYCIECNDFLCEVCSKVHRKSKLSRHHQLLGKDEMPKEKVRGPDDGLCVKHYGELTRFYCQNHRQTVCSVCVTLSHKNCNIDYITHAANVYYESQEYGNLLKNLNDLIVTLQKQKTRSAANADIMNDECARLVSEIETFRSGFDGLLDSMEIAAKTKARELCQKGTNELKTTIKICSKIEEELHDMNTTLQKFGKYQMKQQLFIAAKRAEEKIKDNEPTVLGLSELSKLKKTKFVPRKELIDVLHTFDTLGRIEIQSDEIMHSPDNNQGYDGQKTILEGKKKSNSTMNKIALMGSIGVKAQRDVEDCWITGCVRTDGDSLAVVDRKNTSIKLVNVNNNLITGYFKLLIPPWDITYTEARELVVTCVQIILFIDLPTMKSKKEIKVGGCSYGIEYCQGKLFVTFDQPTPMLQILKTDGVVLKVIPMIETGLRLVSRPIYISVADDCKTVAVSDNLQVVCFNTETLGDIACKLLKSLGISFGCNLDVLFIDESSGNIYLWRPDKLKEAYPLFRTECPQSLAFCKKTDLLYVSHFGPKSNFLSVFKVL